MAGTAQQARRMAPEFPLGRDAASVRQRIDAVERLLERSFTLPGTSQPVGLDAIVGLVPLAGDAVGALMGLYLVWEARNLGMSKWQIARMFGNVGLDAAIGAIPFIGVVGDFFFRSNTRNLKIVRRHLDRHHPGTRVIEG
jgi:AraC-like DNA-binding protein